MPPGPSRVLPAAAAVIFIALALPVAALANGGSKCTASACKVYIEPSSPSAGKQQPSQQSQPPQLPTGPATGGSHAKARKGLARALAHAGADKGPLSNLLAGSGGGHLRAGNVAGPSLLGAAFDLGAGPLALLGILLATALGLAARGSVRGWRRRRSSS
jgi:hypothetical protein